MKFAEEITMSRTTRMMSIAKVTKESAKTFCALVHHLALYDIFYVLR